MSFLDMALESLGRKPPHEGIPNSPCEEAPGTMAALRNELNEINEITPLYMEKELESRSPSLAEYLSMLQVWQPENARDLPPPPFPERPERPIAWGAWWDAIERRNQKFEDDRGRCH